MSLNPKPVPPRTVEDLQFKVRHRVDRSPASGAPPLRTVKDRADPSTTVDLADLILAYGGDTIAPVVAEARRQTG